VSKSSTIFRAILVFAF